MDNNLIKESLNRLNRDYQDFILSGFIQEAAKSFGQKKQLDETGITILENAFTLYLLILMDFEEMINFIQKNCSVSKEDASVISHAFLSLLPENFYSTHASLYTQLYKDDENLSQLGENEESLMKDIEETQSVFNSINTEKIIESKTQEEILKKQY